MRLEVITTERHVLDEQVEMIVAPGASGVIGVLPNHAPLMSALNPGELEVHVEGKDKKYLAIGGGFIEVQPDHVVVLADTAEHDDEIDLQRAEEARRAASDHMDQERTTGGPAAFDAARRALMHAEARLRVGQRSRNSNPSRSPHI